MVNVLAEPLSGTDLATWRSYLVATRLLFEALESRLREVCDISLADYGLLARLAEGDEHGIRMCDLADSTAFSRSRITHAVDRLESQGWVERRACPTDRRGSYARLTRSGAMKLAEADPVHAQVLRQHFLFAMTAGEADILRRRMTEVLSSFEDGDL